MDFKVLIAESAIGDLKEIVEFVARCGMWARDGDEMGAVAHHDVLSLA